MSKQTGDFYKKRKRILEEADRIVDELNITVETASTSFWPDGGVEVTEEELERLLTGCTSADPSTSTVVNSDNGNLHFQELDDLDDEIVDAVNPYKFMENLNLRDALVHLVILGRASQFITEGFLAILRKYFKAKVPKTKRTLLKTPVNIKSGIQPIQGGKIWYHGIEKVLLSYFQNVDPEVEKFTFDISIDGLPLFRSSRKQLWPIQLRILEMPELTPFVVGTFGGSTKPGKLDEFLGPLVTEINNLQERGIQFQNKIVPISLRAFIADSPMRATLKSTMSFNAKHGCLKCTCVGRPVDVGSDGRKIILDSVNADPRTDAGFRQRLDKFHHKKDRSPLEKIENLDMVEGFPVSERMHLVDEGGTQKILVGLVNNIFDKLGHPYPRQKEAVSNFMVKIRLPYEIPRRVRSLNEIQLWKATEYRTFLHYLSVVIFNDILKYEGSFNHFLLYFCGITIFSTKAHQQYWSLAKTMLKEFVRHFGKYYGRTNITSNIHNIQHIGDEVEKYVPLDSYSAYEFENNLRFVKQCVKSGTKIVEQVAGRLIERSHVIKAHTSNISCYPQLRANGRFFINETFSLHKQFQNRWFLTKEKSIVKFVEAKKNSSNSFVIVGDLIESCEELFNVLSDDDNVITDIHLSSVDLFIYKVKLNVSTTRIEVPHTSLKCKLVPMFIPSRSLLELPVRVSPEPQSIALFPMLHTFQD